LWHKTIYGTALPRPIDRLFPKVARLQARHFGNQTCETQIAANVLNRMTALGLANYARAV
jgi:hypothetical protein